MTPAARSGRRSGRKVYVGVAVLVALVLAVLYLTGVVAPAVAVQVATVSQTFPSQTFSVLNASGYVVPQTKSALASKVTGRLVWLGVDPGEDHRSLDSQAIRGLADEFLPERPRRNRGGQAPDGRWRPPRGRGRSAGGG